MEQGSQKAGVQLGGVNDQGEQTVKLRPTLFIAVGGTGMEVALRVRRRILNATWGSAIDPRRVESLEKFHIAEFIHFDLDHGSVVESGKSRKKELDALSELVKLSDEDKLIESFNIEKYSRSDDDLDRYPHIAEWSPLTPRKIRELGIDPSKGAGQIRGVSRLYFFDKYPKLRDMIRNKLHSLKSSLSKEADLKKLGLEIDTSKFRIVVIGSIAGGTGAGSFLDMGWLSGAIASQDVSAHEVDLMMFLPSGYASANKDRTEANGYASLMELETCMKGGSNFVKRWDLHDNLQLSVKPYDEVYLIDSGNLSGQGTEDQKDVYEMVADTLFEDFRSADFANKKRSVAVNQSQHKITPFSAPVPQSRFGDMKLNYFKGYSAFGQSVLDTQSANIIDQGVYSWTKAMLEVFFGVASTDGEKNRATDKQRDEFMNNHLSLKRVLFEEKPRLSKGVELKLSDGTFYDYPLTERLLKDRQGNLLAGIENRVSAELENIADTFEKDDWPKEIRDVMGTLERDCIRNQDRTSDTSEDRITEARRLLRTEIQNELQEKLYQYLDNRELGGLEYVLSLVEQVKEKLSSSHDGVVKNQNDNVQKYNEIKDALRNSEVERLLSNLTETRGKSLFGSKEKQARAILEDLKDEIANYLKFHLRATAAQQAAKLLEELSAFLGENQGIDDQGEAVWSGLVGELQNGRASVMAMLEGIREFERRLAQDNSKTYANYRKIETPVSTHSMPSDETLATWAEEALEEIGGSKELFQKLKSDDGQRQIFRCLSKRAKQEYSGVEQDQKDPLVQALEKMDPASRQKVFSSWLSRAMPWIDANMGREFTPNADQFKCYIGVGRSSDYEAFKEEIMTGLPSSAGVTPAQLSFVDSGTYGRAVCYVELSGVPLTVLRGLETWKTSYLKESEKIPVHTKSDVTLFEHPLVPTVDQLNAISEDFRHFLLATMMGVLKRDTNQSIRPSGQYQFSVGRGDVRRMGNERAFRLNGLPKAYQQKIIDTVCNKLEDLDGWQLMAMAALADSLARDTYTPQLVPDEKGAEVAVQGFASAIAGKLRDELLEKATMRGVSGDEAQRFEEKAYDLLEKWTNAIENSDKDAYSWEVRDSDTPRLKRTAKPEFFDKGWIEQVLGKAPANMAPAAAAPFGAAPPPPPVAQVEHSYYLHVNGENMGPYTRSVLLGYLQSGQVAKETLCWREGWAGWQPVGEVAELQQTAGAVPPPPPPVPVV
ncbi:tubulin-like doman-containing protein [Parendozoicomonas haliclonae]|uniref:GYF domain-containing protein n=1 Tax=Parendozoicomonas haliclonae TaxID=1960125 RepID=A0A1X7ARZ8_9GAMM|nr:tubulin-like doman-containing protein [Parendozoicomonas haliclonae]SMA50197.1 hypothetical protein EHSB41UT_03990 [Parendozoicomonas haliclonae]